MRKISVVIVARNGREYLRKCLKSLFENKDLLEVIVVDNNSEEDIVSLVTEEFPKVTLIKNNRNLGFGAANNLGVGQAKSEIIFFCNPDTIVGKECLQNAKEYFNDHSEVGIIGAKLFVDESRQELQKEAMGRFPRILDLMFRRMNIAQWGVNAPLEVDWVSGAAMFIRRDLFDQLGGFDENFFMYWEDVDLCLRARKLGYKTTYLPTAEVIHFGGKSINSNRTRKQLYYASQNYFFKKHYNLVYQKIMSFFRSLYIIVNYLKLRKGA
jgi:GT2 family glycosyltransferase